MNSRERVIASLEFKSPDRTPRDLLALPYITLFKKEAIPMNGDVDCPPFVGHIE